MYDVHVILNNSYKVAKYSTTIITFIIYTHFKISSLNRPDVPLQKQRPHNVLNATPYVTPHNVIQTNRAALP